jgi:hypothetical protein
MAPDQLVKVKDLQATRDAVAKYLNDNVGWRAEFRDLVWSHRYVIAKLALLANKTMCFSDLVSQVSAALAETTSDLIRRLTPELIAEKMCDALPAPAPVPEPVPAAEDAAAAPASVPVAEQEAE